MTKKIPLLILLIQTFNIFASENDTDSLSNTANEIIITAGRYPATRYNLPESVSLITTEELKTNSLRSTPETLFGAAGAWVQKTNHGGGSVFLRGLTGNQVLMLVDGIRMNNSTYRYGPNQYLNTIDPHSIRRIEALKGAGSVLYGSDAIGGAINLLMKEPTLIIEGINFSGKAFGKYMSEDMEKSANAELSLAAVDFGIITGVSYRNFGDLVPGGNMKKASPSGYDEMSFYAKAKYMIDEKSILTAAFRNFEQNDVPVTYKIVLENYERNNFTEQDSRLAYLKYDHFTGSDLLKYLSLTASWQNSDEKRDKRKAGSTKTTYEEDEVNTYSLVAETGLFPVEYWRITAGAEMFYDIVNSTANDNDTKTGIIRKRGLYPDDSKAMNAGMFLLNTLDFDKALIKFGVRYNYNNIRVGDTLFGNVELEPSALVWDLGAVYKLTDFLRLTGNINTSFRAPNIDDLGTLGIVDFRYEIPALSLKPEFATKYELGLKSMFEGFYAEFSVYRTDLKDLITREKSSLNGRDSVSGYQVYTKKNTAEAYIWGCETDIKYTIGSNLTLAANLAYTFGEDISKKEPMRRIPPLTGSLKAGYQFGFASLALEWIAAGRQDRLAGGDKADNRINPNGTPGWNILNIYGSAELGDFMVSLSLQNLFDRAYRVHGSGIDGYGRSLWLSIRYEFMMK